LLTTPALRSKCKRKKRKVVSHNLIHVTSNSNVMQNFEIRSGIRNSKFRFTAQSSAVLSFHNFRQPIQVNIHFFFQHATAFSGPGPPLYRDFNITRRHTTLSRTPLDEWSARRRDLYLTTHNTHKRQISIPSVGFEPAIPASERQQTHALDLPVTGIYCKQTLLLQNKSWLFVLPSTFSIPTLLFRR